MRRIREIRNAKVIVSNVDRWPNIFARKLFWKEMSHHLAKDRLSGTLREFQQEALEIFQHALSFIKRGNISQWLIAGAIAQGEELCDGRIDWNNSAVDGSVAFAWVCQEREKKNLCPRWRCYLAEISSRICLIDRCVSFRETRSVDRSQSWLRLRRVVWRKNVSSHLKPVLWNCNYDSKEFSTFGIVRCHQGYKWSWK